MQTKDLTDYALIDGEEYYVENHDPHVIDKDKALEHLEGDVEYVGYWFVKDAKGYVFHAKNPDRSKGHKDYVVIKYVYNYMMDDYDFYIAGYDRAEMEERSIQVGQACRHCKTVIWSLSRHDYHSCRCKKDGDQVCIDGGTDYYRLAFGKNSDSFPVTVNHLTKTITKRNLKS